MAIYHLCCKIFSRSKGQTAVAAAAYRSGTKLEDFETGIISDFTKKRGIVYSEVSLCKNAPSEYADREVLWNAVQEREKSKDAQLCREFEVAIPNELSLAEKIDLVRSFTSSLNNEGMCVDASIHDKGNNPHAHILANMRPISENGKWTSKQKKVYSLDKDGNKIPIIDPKTGKQKIGARGRKMWQRETILNNPWDSKDKLMEWRKRWADLCNDAIDKKNNQIKESNLEVNVYAQEPLINHIDHRSYKDQGIDQIATIHEGWQARKMERLGMKSDRVDENRQIRMMNTINLGLNKMCKNYRKKNELHYLTYQKEVDNYEERIRNFKSDFERSEGTTGSAGSDHQYVIYADAKNSQSERDALEDFASLQRRNEEDDGVNEGLRNKSPSIEEIMSMSLLIDSFNDDVGQEADDLIDAIFSMIFNSKKKKKNHGLQFVR